MARKSLSKDIAGVEANAAPPTRARSPRQPRGQARFDAILDAAAALVAKEGRAGVTMHTLAHCAETSVGSLYHFFPDRDGVLEALRQRHAAATRTIGQELRKIPAATWRQYSAHAAIECLITPFVKYLRHHPDFLPLTAGRTTTEEDADFIRVIRHVLDARLPKLKPADRQTYASMLHAISVGTMHAGLQAGSRFVEICLLELPRVLSAYLSAIEANGKSLEP